MNSGNNQGVSRRSPAGFGALLLGGLLGASSPTGSFGAAAPERLNVLFIAVDDLRPQLGCYGDTVIKTPNIDRLAKNGFVFDGAYCQMATCSPSRHSLLTGRRPDTTHLHAWDDIDFRAVAPEAVTLPQHFKSNGYHTQGLGKIFHGLQGHAVRGKLVDSDPVSWSVPKWMPTKPRWGPEGEKLLHRIKNDPTIPTLNDEGSKPGMLPYEAPDVGDGDLADGETADKAVATLQTIKDKPFFLAVGFWNPHLPFVAPKKYWDMYDEAKIPAPTNPDVPRGAPPWAPSNWGELRNIYAGMPKKGPVTERQARELRHGYYAAVTYVDTLVGKVLAELDRLNLREKTVVVLWGDHGWQLGEHGQWSKHSNYEASTKVPLIISVPGAGSPRGRSSRLVEYTDVYPSLAEICGLSQRFDPGVEGLSFLPLMREPNRPWKNGAFSQFGRVIPEIGRSMGRAIRTERYRLVEWAVPEKNFVRRELYDYVTDPGEMINLAAEPGHEQLEQELARALHAGWRGALPVGFGPGINSRTPTASADPSRRP